MASVNFKNELGNKINIDVSFFRRNSRNKCRIFISGPTTLCTNYLTVMESKQLSDCLKSELSKMERLLIEE